MFEADKAAGLAAAAELHQNFCSVYFVLLQAGMGAWIQDLIYGKVMNMVDIYNINQLSRPRLSTGQ
jgi:hypothetical protein